MDKTMIVAILFVAAVLAADDAQAETETVGGYTWTCQINGETAY